MKIKKILFLSLIIIISFYNNVYAKYIYKFDETIAVLKRDGEKPICNISYSEEEWTNKNVILKIESNKEIQQVSGFNLSEDKKVLTKKFSKNSKGTLKIRDFSGNCEELEYEINNIDKEPPQIIGCEDGGVYNEEISLDFVDNNQIKDIYIDKYDDNLNIESYRDYYDSYFYYGIDKTSSSLTVHIKSHPKNTRKYRFFINDKLYTTSSEENYTFTGLEKGKEYEVKVEALDSNGNILESCIKNYKTSYYSNINSQKTDKKFIATFEGLDSSVSEIKYAVWNVNNSKNINWYDASIKQKKANIEILSQNSIYYDAYTCHAYLYDEYNNILDVIEFSIDFGTNYIENEEIQTDKYNLTESGNYQISVTDFANNVTTYYIKIK